MSYNLYLTGRDKAKLKEAVRKEQVEDEEKNPHGGVPKWIADHICDEIDRVRVYEFSGKRFAIDIAASGSFHEQGNNHSLIMKQVQLVE
jgi:hypothetical protein